MSPPPNYLHAQCIYFLRSHAEFLLKPLDSRAVTPHDAEILHSADAQGDHMNDRTATTILHRSDDRAERLGKKLLQAHNLPRTMGGGAIEIVDRNNLQYRLVGIDCAALLRRFGFDAWLEAKNDARDARDAK